MAIDRALGGGQMGKAIAVGVTGSIAAFKAAQLVSNLRKKGFQVHVLMTRNAAEFVTPVTFETLSANRVSIDTFDRNFEWNVQHISLARRAQAFVIAPATANAIAKMAHGIADDMLSTTVLAARCPVIVCPAMNTGMYENPATQDNLRTLAARGVLLVEPGVGFLAEGVSGKGRLAELWQIEDALDMALHTDKPLAGRTVLVTAGATREAIDPVRYITNHSTGKMGYAIARAARNMGADAVLLTSAELPDPWGVRVRRAGSALEMYQAAMEETRAADLVVAAAAVADYRPGHVARQKIKKGEGPMALTLERTDDILAALCRERRPGQWICGFSAETENLVENSTAKLHKKGCDMIVANDLTAPGAGFGADTNAVSIITADGVSALPLMGKDTLAEEILTRLARMGAL